LGGVEKFVSEVLRGCFGAFGAFLVPQAIPAGFMVFGLSGTLIASLSEQEHNTSYLLSP
jgi:hypothetical protein